MPDKLENTFPFYGEKTYVPLKKKKWVLITKDILRREGGSEIPIFVEPGKWFHWKAKKTFWGKVRDFLLGKEEVCTLGTHMTIHNPQGVKIWESIHFREHASASEMMDTIVHEVAHALVPSCDHEEPWKKEYRRLREKYVVHPTVVSDNDKGVTEKL